MPQPASVVATRSGSHHRHHHHHHHHHAHHGAKPVENGVFTPKSMTASASPPTTTELYSLHSRTMSQMSTYPETSHSTADLHDIYRFVENSNYRPCSHILSRTQRKLVDERRGSQVPSRPSRRGGNNDSNTMNVHSSRTSRLDISQGTMNFTSFQLRSVLTGFSHVTCLIIRGLRLNYLCEEIGQLVHLVILDAGRNSLSDLPHSMYTLSKLRALILDSNEFFQPPEVLFHLFSLRYLDLTDNPLAEEWKSLYKDGSEASLQSFMRMITDSYTLKYVLSTPPKRMWKSFLPNRIPNQTTMEMTIMSYNVLCPKYATFTQYPYCPTFALEANFRRTAILKEINTHSADIIALQELDILQLNDFYVNELHSRGYQHSFVTKNRGHFEHDPGALDGCAIFWKTSKFEFIEKQEIRFNDLSMMLEDGARGRTHNETMLNRLMPRDNSALVLFLRCKDTNQYICVSNGHLFWDPEYCDVKLVQSIMWTALMLKHMANFYQTHISPPLSAVVMSKCDSPEKDISSEDVFVGCASTGKSRPHAHEQASTGKSSGALSRPPERRRASSVTCLDERTGSGRNSSSGSSHHTLSVELLEEVLKAIPVVLCGDFNSLPESGAVQYLTGGHVEMQHEDFLSHSKGYALNRWRLFEPLCNNDNTLLRHGLELDTAYLDANDMKYTNYTNNFKGIIDYILFSRRHFSLIGYLGGVAENWFSAENGFYGCPNAHVPSDHFPLVAKLRLSVPGSNHCSSKESSNGRAGGGNMG